jgi:pimeloyl-ACP methyl ester carboxylesterase
MLVEERKGSDRMLSSANISSGGPVRRSFKAELFGATALTTAGGKLRADQSPTDRLTLSLRAQQNQPVPAGVAAKPSALDPNRVPATLQRPLILVHGIRSGASTFTDPTKEGQAPPAVDYLTRNKNNIFGGTIVGVNAQGKLLVVPRPTPENPKPKPTTEVPAGANLFTIDMNKGSNTIEQNGGELRDAIEAIAQAKDASNPGTRSKVDIMGWSHGGLDGLRAAEMTGDRVAHLTTLGTPFQGTLIAPLHPILRALETWNLSHLFGPDPIRDELSPGSQALQELLKRRDDAKGLKIMNVSGVGIDLGGGDGVIDPNSSRLPGALVVKAHGYAHTRMHNAPDVIDQVLSFNSGEAVQTSLSGSGTFVDLVM